MFLARLLYTLLTGVTLLLVAVVTSVWGARARECGGTFYAMELRTCFKYNRMEVNVVDRNSVANTSIRLEGLLNHPRNVCQEQATYMQLLDCLRGATAKCVVAGDSQFVVDENQTTAGIPFLCRHINDIDIPCYVSTYSHVFDCVRTLTDQILQEHHSFGTQVCTAADIIHDCIQVKVDCDVTTREILLQFHDDYRKPRACPSPTRSFREPYITASGAANITSFLAYICLAILALAVSLH